MKLKELKDYQFNHLMGIFKIKTWILTFSIILGSFFLTGCEKDDDPAVEPITEQTEEKDNNENSEESGQITLYKITEEKLKKIKDYEVTGEDLKIQQDKTKHLKLWNLTKRIIPQDYRNYIGEFMIINSEEIAGYVVEINDDLSKWQFGLAINLAYDGGEPENNKEFIYTIIHEFGHILCLNKSQVDATIGESDCTHYYTGEGCAREASYFYPFYKRFWEPIWHEFIKVESDEDIYAFYEKYDTQFVSDYAATNPGEDFAETFATFVMSDKPESTSIANKKLLFMHQQDELVKLRDHIRTELKANLGLKSVRISRIPWKR